MGFNSAFKGLIIQLLISIIRIIKERGLVANWDPGVVVRRGFLWSNLRERDHLEDVGIDGRIILKCNVDWVEGRGLTDFSQGRNKCPVFVNAVMNPWVP